ncbi:hypothetical protein BU16DRAFT_597866 [Lophium mytilinum]|uniref:RING-type domain-containing protein n=1 Tax=Lophium mytilinum TaxID=390894 RepID=A0A6A6QBR9_9PEZI|nr:hypothetical protein BU16DRAFT_597866 [Lophium mytilinum]
MANYCPGHLEYRQTLEQLALEDSVLGLRPGIDDALIHRQVPAPKLPAPGSVTDATPLPHPWQPPFSRLGIQCYLDGVPGILPTYLPENERTCIICLDRYGPIDEGDTQSNEDETKAGTSTASYDPSQHHDAIRLPSPCKHVFGRSCIKTHFQSFNDCPLCRRQWTKSPFVACVLEIRESWFNGMLVDDILGRPLNRNQPLAILLHDFHTEFELAAQLIRRRMGIPGPQTLKEFRLVIDEVKETFAKLCRTPIIHGARTDRPYVVRDLLFSKIASELNPYLVIHWRYEDARGLADAQRYTQLKNLLQTAVNYTLIRAQLRQTFIPAHYWIKKERQFGGLTNAEADHLMGQYGWEQLLINIIGVRLELCAEREGRPIEEMF